MMGILFASENHEIC